MEALQHEDILYTTDYIENLPEGQRAELIDGHIYDMGTPSRIHQDITIELATTIKNYIKSKKGLCKVYTAPLAVYLNKDNKTYLEPDVFVVCDKSKLIDKGCWGSPDWVIEIVSPTSKQRDYLIKMIKYSTAGVREYWIVDPLKERVTAYNFEAETMEEYNFNDIIKVAIYEDLEINFAELDIE